MRVGQEAEVRVVRIAGGLTSAQVPDLLAACREANCRVSVDLSDLLRPIRSQLMRSDASERPVWKSSASRATCSPSWIPIERRRQIVAVTGPHSPERSDMDEAKAVDVLPPPPVDESRKARKKRA